jgi:hypothetical protein
MSLEESKPNSKFSCSFYTLRLCFLSFFKKFWIPKFHKLFKEGPLVMGAQELEENFSLHLNEISLVIIIIGFGYTGY